jgi:hypothetical protein
LIHNEKKSMINQSEMDEIPKQKHTQKTNKLKREKKA